MLKLRIEDAIDDCQIQLGRFRKLLLQTLIAGIFRICSDRYQTCGCEVMNCGNIDCPFTNKSALNGELPTDGLDCLIIDAVMQVNYSKGDILFSQGQPSCCVYALTNGIVKITCLTADGHEQIVGLSSPRGLLVGLQSLTDSHYAYSAVAETDVAACKIKQRALMSTVRHDGEVATSLVKAVNIQLENSRALLRVIGHHHAAAKIAAFILLIIPDSDHGRHRFKLPFSRSEIANLLGLSEETVCRQMAIMKRNGILYAPRGSIEILDWDELQEIADEVHEAA
jgi:CRP/FNR family transcriptional regulator